MRSLLGPNPLLGARFYGIGNELEVALAEIALLGVGAAVAPRRRGRGVWGFAVGGGVLALLLGVGAAGRRRRCGPDVGVGAAAAALVAAGAAPGGRARRDPAVAPALAIAALAALDLATGGDAHFTRSVLRAGGLRELGEVAQRRFELSYTRWGAG